MARLGEERKPLWSAVPRELRDGVGRALGSPVSRAIRAYGGYAPSATFHLTLRDGRRAFFKGVNATSNDFMREGLQIEERVYAELSGLVGRWMPAYLGALRHDDWHVLLLEDLGRADVPPWTVDAMRAAASDYAAFHAATRDSDLPAWLRGIEFWSSFTDRWARITQDEGSIEALADLASSRAAEARRWLHDNIGALRDAAERGAAVGRPWSLLHLDTRSDNLRLRAGLRLFDWNWACVGPPEFDVVELAQSIASERGPVPEAFVTCYAATGALRGDALDSLVAAIAGVFANGAWRPAPPDLPRLRIAQRRQLRSSLAWAAERLRLEAPRWLEAVPDR